MAAKKSAKPGTFQKGQPAPKGNGRKKGTPKTGGRKKGTLDRRTEIRENLLASAGGNAYKVTEAFQQAFSHEDIESFNNAYERMHVEGSPVELLAYQTVARALRNDKPSANFLTQNVLGSPAEHEQRAQAMQWLQEAMDEIRQALENEELTLERLQFWEIQHWPTFVQTAIAESIFTQTVTNLREWVKLQQNRYKLENERLYRQEQLLLSKQMRITRTQAEQWIALNYETMYRFANDPKAAYAYYQEKLQAILPEYLGVEADEENAIQAYNDPVDSTNESEGGSR